MLSLIQRVELTPINKLHAGIVLIAMLIAAQIQYIQHGWINPDTVLYFESARLFSSGQWKESLQVWNWPLYPLCIAAIHKITNLGIQASAQILNVVFFGLTTLSFIQIIRLAGGSQLTMVSGAFLLFGSQYIVGDVLGMLMRDEGFWAFYLTGLAFFIRFSQRLHIKDAVLWQLCAIIATLFRIEGITYLILLPLFFVFSFNTSLKDRLHHILASHSLNILLALALVLAIALDGNLSLKSLGRLQEVFTLNLYDELTGSLFSKAEVMSNQVLGKYLEEYAIEGLLITFLYAIFVKTISATGLINSIMAVFAIRNRVCLIEPKAFNVLGFVAIISLVNMALIITKVFVLSGRYVLALAFILIIFASFQLTRILKNASQEIQENPRAKWLSIALVIFMSLGIVKNTLPKPEGYNYMQDAAAWVKADNKNNLPVFSDDSRVRYYLGSPFVRNNGQNWEVVSREIDANSIQNYEYLLISNSTKHAEREKIIANKLPQFREVKRFYSVKSKKSIVIYQRKAP